MFMGNSTSSVLLRKISSYSFHLRAAIGLLALGFALPSTAATLDTTRRIFVAKKIITMDEAKPTATAVAVQSGKIISVGTLSNVVADMRKLPYVLNTTYSNAVIVPGFVEAHSHLQGYGLYSSLPYIGYFDRKSPAGVLQKGVTNFAAVISALKNLAQKQRTRLDGSRAPVVAFGLDPIFFPTEIPGRRITRQILDEVSTNTPIFLPLLSGHVVACNTRMLQLVMAETNWPAIKDTVGVIKDTNGVPTGELDEVAADIVAFAALQKADPLFFLSRGFSSLSDGAKLAQRNGVTTATDLAFGAEPKTSELAARAIYQVATYADEFPLRVVLGYFADQLIANWGTNAVKHLRVTRGLDTPKLITGPVKIITDGSIQGYTAELEPPGYWDVEDPNPMWNVDPGLPLYNLCLPFWKADFQIAVHVNGDEATRQMLDVLEALQQDFPKTDHRFSLQHNQVSHPEYFTKMAQLGATVNLFCNHLYYYGDQHYAITLGTNRANLMDSPAMAKAAGVPFSLHSDAPVTPMAPLFAMWCAVNRQTASGRVLDDPNNSQKISVQDALQAVTLGGAYLLKLEKKIGSITVGKNADFAVLGQDPYAVDPMAIKDIPVKATVLGGKVFPVK